MYCIASRRVLPALSEEERQSLLTQAHLHSLVEMLEAIPDPRGKRRSLSITLVEHLTFCY